MNEQERNELRVKVAKLMGVKPTTECHECFGTGYTGSETSHEPCDECKTTGKVKPYCISPDYPNDLNACHEFEETLSNLQLQLYVEELVGKKWHETWSVEDAIGLVVTTPTQRCRAFVATMEKGEHHGR